MKSAKRFSRLTSFVLAVVMIVSAFAVVDLSSLVKSLDATEAQSLNLGTAEGNQTNLSLTSAVGSDVVAPVRGNKSGGSYSAYRTEFASNSVDGFKDAAYNYGAHFYGDLPANTPNNSTTFDAYVSYGTDGLAHIYCEIYDKDIVVNDELWNYKNWHCDSMDIYVYFGSAGNGNAIYNVVAPSANTYPTPSGKRAPDSLAVVRTPNGWAFEMTVRYNHNTSFANNNVLGIAFYYNDAYNYTSISSYTKTTVTNKCNAFSSSYVNPTYSKLDTVKFLDNGSPVTDISILSNIKNVKTAVVYPKDASPFTIKTAEDIKAALGANATVVAEGTSISSYTYAVLVGHVNSYAETKYMLDTVGYNGYGVAVFGNKVSILGATEEMLGAAATAFIDQISGTAVKKALYSGYSDRVGGAGLPWLKDATLVTDSGYGSFQIIKNGATQAQYNAYKNALADLGYSLYTTNTMGGKYQSATYHNDENIVTVNYGKHFSSKLYTDVVGNISTTVNSLRVMVDSKNAFDLPTKTVPSYTPSAQSVLVQVGPTNLCEIIRLDNGEFIIIDSGSRGNGAAILSELAALSPDGHPVIAAWYFSHFHQDHIGGFIDIAYNNDFSRLTVKNIIFNFGSKQATDTASSGDQYNLARWQQCLDNTGANVIYGHAGQVFKFANATLEILYTFEDTQPYYIPYKRADQSDVRSNPTNELCSVTVRDSKTGTSQKFMFTGDSAVEQFTLATLRYGTYLKSDFVQLSHHGWGDYGVYTAYYQNGLNFYNTVGAKYVLVPRPGDRNIRSQVDQKVVAAATEAFYACAADGTTGVANRLALPYPTATYTFPTVAGFDSAPVDHVSAGMQDSDNGIPFNGDNVSVTRPFASGTNGEYMYLANTVYTDIVTDGVMDSAYTYGLHLTEGIADNGIKQTKYPVTFDAYIVAGQDGRLHVFAEITDSSYSVSPSTYYHKDGFDFWYGFGGNGATTDVRFIAVNSSGSDNQPQIDNNNTDAALKTGGLFNDYKVTLVRGGDENEPAVYTVEFSFDNNGVPFKNGDKLSFGCYVNTTASFIDNSGNRNVGNTDGYVKHTVMAHTAQTASSGVYMVPNNPVANLAKHNVLVFSDISAVAEYDRTTAGTDVTAPPASVAVSAPTSTGTNGEYVYTAKTVNTNIVTDGKMDLAYAYGVHLVGNRAENTTIQGQYPTTFDAYLVAGEDGRIHVFAKITDASYTVSPPTSSYWRKDGFDFWYGFGGTGVTTDVRFIAVDSSFANTAPQTEHQGSAASRLLSGGLFSDFVVDIPDNAVENGAVTYTVEFSFDNNGVPFENGDRISFGCYVNAAANYNTANGSYVKTTIMADTALSAANGSYMNPNSPTANMARHNVLSVSTAFAASGIYKSDDSDDGVEPNYSGFAYTSHDRTSDGKYVYDARTIYTDIVTDGVMDAAYTYGIHIKGDRADNVDRQTANPTTFDAYIISGQDGRVHVFARVEDASYTVTPTTFYHKDCFDFWYGFDESGVTADVRFIAVNSSSDNVSPQVTLQGASNAAKLQQGQLFSDFEVRLIEGGAENQPAVYTVEFSFDNNGVPFEDGDRISFGCYVNTSSDCTSATQYVKHTVMADTAKSDSDGAYMNPNNNTDKHNILAISSQSASGNVDRVLDTDDGIAASANASGITAPYTFGENGEYVYVANTAYTDIFADGVMDNAYTHGIHLQMDKASNADAYALNPIDFDVYLVAGQDGRIYVYADVTDPDRAVGVDNTNWWRQDSFDFWYGFGDQIATDVRFMAVSSSSANVTPQANVKNGSADLLAPGGLFNDFAVVLKSDGSGYVVEFSFNNNGEAFEDLDEIFFGCYVNTTDDYNATTKAYVNYTAMADTAKSFADGTYMTPNAGGNVKLHNKLVFSYMSVSDTTKAGSDDNVPARETQKETDFVVSNRGVTDFSAYSVSPQKVYGLNKVYTTPTTDGVKDAIYTYGLRLQSRYADNVDSYANYPASFEVYMVNAEDGKIHVFIEVTDPEIELRPSSYWHRDSIDFYYEFGNGGTSHTNWHFRASETQSNGSRPADYTVVMTDKGFNVEFSFDNNGEDFKVGDEFAFGVFYNNCSNYNAADGSYTKYTLMMETLMSDLKGSYVSPNGTPYYNDAVKIISERSETK